MLRLFLSLLFLFMLCSEQLDSRSAIMCSLHDTLPLTQRRFGDALLWVTSTMWLAQKYGITFLYTPFYLSNKLNLHTKLRRFEHADLKRYNRVVHIKDEYRDTIDPDADILYTTGFYTKLISCTGPSVSLWEAEHNVDFLNYLKSLVAPLNSLQLVKTPKHKIAVALHVRRGGGYDRPLLSRSLPSPVSSMTGYADVLHPTKFPPDSYYIEQLKGLSDFLNNPPMYVYVFTDDSDPDIIVERYKRSVSKPNIEFFLFQGKNKYITHELIDFFSMSLFDCLIRPASMFSLCAEKIGAFKIVVSPTNHVWQGKILIIDKAKFDIKDKNWVDLVRSKQVFL